MNVRQRRGKLYANPITECVDLFPNMWYTVCIKFSNTVYVSMQEVRHMFMEERHREISEALQANGKITIAEIAGKYGISDESAPTCGCSSKKAFAGEPMAARLRSDRSA